MAKRPVARISAPKSPRPHAIRCSPEVFSARAVFERRHVGAPVARAVHAAPRLGRQHEENLVEQRRRHAAEGFVRRELGEGEHRVGVEREVRVRVPFGEAAAQPPQDPLSNPGLGAPHLGAPGPPAVVEDRVGPSLAGEIGRDVKQNLMILGVVAHPVHPGLIDPKFEAPERRVDAAVVGGTERRWVGKAVQQRQQVDGVEVGAVAAVLQEFAGEPHRVGVNEPRAPDLNGRERAEHLRRHAGGVGERLQTPRLVGIAGRHRGRAGRRRPQPNLPDHAERRPVGRAQPKPPSLLKRKGRPVIVGRAARETRGLSGHDPELRRRDRSGRLEDPAPPGNTVCGGEAATSARMSNGAGAARSSSIRTI